MSARYRKGAASVVALGLLALAGCDRPIVDSDVGLRPDLALALAVAPELQASAEAGAAFDQADRIRVRLLRGETVGRDTTLAFEPAAVNRVRIGFLGESDPGLVQVEVTLLRRTDPLFTGSDTARLALGTVRQVPIELQAVVAGLELDASRLEFVGVDDTLRVSAHPVFATGDRVPGRTPTWSSDDPTVVAIRDDGLAVSLSEGSTVLTARLGTLAASLPADVDACGRTVLGLNETVVRRLSAGDCTFQASPTLVRYQDRFTLTVPGPSALQVRMDADFEVIHGLTEPESSSGPGRVLAFVRSNPSASLARETRGPHIGTPVSTSAAPSDGSYQVLLPAGQYDLFAGSANDRVTGPYSLTTSPWDGDVAGFGCSWAPYVVPPWAGTQAHDAGTDCVRQLEIEGQSIAKIEDAYYVKIFAGESIVVTTRGTGPQTYNVVPSLYSGGDELAFYAARRDADPKTVAWTNDLGRDTYVAVVTHALNEVGGIAVSVEGTYEVEIRSSADPPPAPTGVGTIEVVDGGGSPLPGVEVRLTGGPAGGPLVATTDAEGEARFVQVVAGDWNVELRRDGSLETTGSIEIDRYAENFFEFEVETDDDTPVTGPVRGTIRDAQTGSGITAATVRLLDGDSFSPIATAVTGSGGAYLFSDVATGRYRVEASATGYLSASRDVVLETADGVQQDLALAASGTGPSNGYRVVLTWGETPSDLDAHLTGPGASSTAPGESGRFHVFFGQRGSLTSEPFAQLDTDDTSSFGPETITFIPSSGVYRYSVHDYSNSSGSPPSTGLAQSGARVEVYFGDTLVQTYEVPQGEGTLWTVFEYDGGTYTPVNTLRYESDSDAVTVRGEEGGKSGTGAGASPPGSTPGR